MLSLEQQIQNLADAAFDATKPVDIPASTPETNGRFRLMVVAAAIVVGMVATAAFLTSRIDEEVIVVADETSTAIEISDPVNIDLSGIAEASAQERIARLGAVTIVDTNDVVGFDSEPGFLVSSVGGEGYEYWQQFSVMTTNGVELVVNVFGTETAWPAIDAATDEAVTVRNQAGRQSDSGLMWLESDQVRVEIVSGPSTGGASISEEARLLAEALSFVQRTDAWSQGDEDLLGGTVVGDPILAGLLGDIEWDVVHSNGELIVRSGDLDRLVFNQQFNSTATVSYGVGPLPNAGGALLFGFVPAGVNQVELVLADTTRVLLPTVPLGDTGAAFAVPIDDRIDPVEIRLLDEGTETQEPIDLRDLPPYLGGFASASK